MRVGVDTGGTFTDVVTADGQVRKVSSTPADPFTAVAAGVTEIDVSLLAHGTTVATNAVLEARGASIALVTNCGLEDVIEIARQNRPTLYDQWADRPPPLVPRDRRHGVAGRLAADGVEIEALALDDLPAIDPSVAAVAVCLVHSDIAPEHERAVADALHERGHEVVCSHEVSPEFREYERTVTTVIDAALRPVCRGYLQRLATLAPTVRVMTSAGGLIDVEAAAEHPVSLLVSGPAAGVRAAAPVAAATGVGGAVSFDMGGTSTDVCLIVGGLPEPAPSLVVGGYPVRRPSLDIHSIGAGGGSLAWIDAGGALHVGPRSAGATPGPVCYRRGGTQPTVTDADLVLGRIPVESVFPDVGALDIEGARDALAEVGTTADDVVTVVDAAMVEAVRAVTVARGVDPRSLALVAFGGAGPLHACALAEALDMEAVIVPARAGALSAVGLLAAPDQRDLVRSWADPNDHASLDAARDALGSEAARIVGAPDPHIETWIDCRYAGQSHEITVTSVGDFHAEHERRNGYRRPDDRVEVTALRARASTPSTIDPTALPPIGERRPLDGPVVVSEPDCTIWIPAGWHAEVAAAGAYVVRRR
jgi:N-methylhydantoinase A/oxoprolinase/acetone carboxylase beta subunit